MGEEIDIRDRVAGSLYGLLVGDAMGCPVEGWSAAKIAKRYGRLSRLEGRGRRLRGLHSDDGQQALAVCDALLEVPGAPLQAFVRTLLDLYRLGPQKALFGLHRGTGRNFRSVVEGLCKAPDALHAHACATAGNGAAMRIAPAALHARDDPERLRHLVIEFSAVTHADLRGIAAAHAVAVLVARASSASDAAASLLDSDWVEEMGTLEVEAKKRLPYLSGDDAISRCMRDLCADLARPLDLKALLRRIEVRATPLASRPVAATSGFALCSVPTAVAVFAKTSSFKEALETAVNLGGDADTIGAMTGSLAGALYGLRGIPADWLQALVSYDDLRDRIDGLVERQVGAPTMSLLTLERMWVSRSLEEKSSRG